MISYRQADLFDKVKPPDGVINFYNPGDDYVMVENAISKDWHLQGFSENALESSGFLKDDQRRYFYVIDPSDPQAPSAVEIIQNVATELEKYGRNIKCKWTVTGIEDINGRATIEVRK